MNALFSQERRQGRLTTALGRDVLVLLRMDGVEEISGLFEWKIEALSSSPNIDLTRLLGTHASVLVDIAGDTRAFDGIVTEARHIGVAENGFRYNLTLRPWLHLAGLRRNQRIFHRMTVVQILEELLGAYTELGSPHLELRLRYEYPELEYTVQYGESDADFAARQMERFGISWCFRHDVGNHTLVLCDSAEALDDVPGGVRPYWGDGGRRIREEEHFNAWSSGVRVTTGAVRLTEYNFKTPKVAQEVDRLGPAVHAYSQVESFDWPGDYLDPGEGRGVVTRRMEAEGGQAPRHHATGDVVKLGAGTCVSLAGGDHVPGASGQRFVCLRAEHRFRSQAYGTGDAQGDESPYEGSYVLLPDTAPLVPERRTASPRVQGPETAIVVGEGEIDCDEHGRILARFHWDLTGAHTMRMRVSQNWASKGWGGMVIPRIGMEVIVEHLRGDPDKPIVVGCVYNGANRPPYELPKHKTRSTFKTDTHEGHGYNELRFEDEKDKEEIFLHAQKDHNTVILNNESHQIGNDRSKVVGNDQKERVNRDKQIDIGRDHVETIGQDEKKTVMRNSERQVDKDSFDYVNNHRIEYTYANHQEEVGAHHYMKVEGDSEVAVGQKLFARSKVQVLHAKDKFIIGGPGGTIEINNTGVVIRANKIDLKGPVNVTTGSPDQIASLESAVNEGLDLAQICIRKLTDE